MTDIHKARSINTTTCGSKARTLLKKSLRPLTMPPQNGTINKSVFQARQSSVESSAFVMPKNTPQKRPHENVVKEMRLNERASNGPTSRAGHNAIKTPKLIVFVCQEYSAANTRQISKLRKSERHIHLLLYLETLGASV